MGVFSSIQSIPIRLLREGLRNTTLTISLDTDLDANSHAILGLATPLSPSSAATKAYVDNHVSAAPSAGGCECLAYAPEIEVECPLLKSEMAGNCSVYGKKRVCSHATPAANIHGQPITDSDASWAVNLVFSHSSGPVVQFGMVSWGGLPGVFNLPFAVPFASVQDTSLYSGQYFRRSIKTAPVSMLVEIDPSALTTTLTCSGTDWMSCSVAFKDSAGRSVGDGSTSSLTARATFDSSPVTATVTYDGSIGSFTVEVSELSSPVIATLALAIDVDGVEADTASRLADARLGTLSNPAVHCRDLRDRWGDSGWGGSPVDGPFVIDFGGSTSYNAFCVQSIDGGGWTVAASFTGAAGESQIVADGTGVGDPLAFEFYNTPIVFKEELSVLSTESLFLRNDGSSFGVWLKTTSPLFDGSLSSPSQHPHNSVTLTSSDGTTYANAVQGYSNYNNAGGGDYGITDSGGFDHHSAGYWHLNRNCEPMFLYTFASGSAGFNVNLGLGDWTPTIACTNSGGQMRFLAASR